jgi:hypothetical protein
MTTQRALQFPNRWLTPNGLPAAAWIATSSRGTLLRALTFEHPASNVVTDTLVSYASVIGNVDAKLMNIYEQKDGTVIANVMFVAPDASLWDLGQRTVYSADAAAENVIPGDCSIKPST